MSCKYCDIKMRPLDEDTKVLKGENWKDDGFDDDGGYIGQSVDDKFRMVVYYDAGFACTEVPDIKFCPFCGAELTMPAEPLIKEEKIRKAIRAWAEANDVEEASIRSDYCLASEEDEDVTIVFASPIFKDIDNDDFYDIDDLCGEEEE